MSSRRDGVLRFLRERRRYWIVPIGIMITVVVIFFLVVQGARLLPALRAWF